MAATEVHRLRLPRLVTGVAERCRATETIAAWDPVPVELRAAADSEAPVALSPLPGASGEGVNGDVRVLDGRPYIRLGPPGLAPEEAWELTLAAVRGHMLPWQPGHAAHAASPQVPDLVYGWREALGGASFRHGLGLDRPTRFRLVRDEGTAPRAAFARRLAERMAVIGGDAWIQAGLPRARVTCALGRLTVLGLAPPLAWSEDAPVGAPWDVASFRLDRGDDIRAFAAAASGSLGIGTHTRADYAIVDRGLLAACYDAAGDEDALALDGTARSVVQALRPVLGYLPDAEIARFVALRDIARSGDALAFRSWMEGIEATRVAAAAVTVPAGFDSCGLGLGLLGILELAEIRHREVDRPRMLLAGGDAAALRGLGA